MINFTYWPRWNPICWFYDLHLVTWKAEPCQGKENLNQTVDRASLLSPHWWRLSTFKTGCVIVYKKHFANGLQVFKKQISSVQHWRIFRPKISMSRSCSHSLYFFMLLTYLISPLSVSMLSFGIHLTLQLGRFNKLSQCYETFLLIQRQCSIWKPSFGRCKFIWYIDFYATEF